MGKAISKVNYEELNAAKRFCNKDVIEDVAEELGLPVHLITDIVETQSKFTLQTIQGGGLETIMYVYLGKFKINPRQVQKLMAKSMRI
jgi:glutamate formiminotransferase